MEIVESLSTPIAIFLDANAMERKRKTTGYDLTLTTAYDLTIDSERKGVIMVVCVEYGKILLIIRGRKHKIFGYP